MAHRSDRRKVHDRADILKSCRNNNAVDTEIQALTSKPDKIHYRVSIQPESVTARDLQTSERGPAAAQFYGLSESPPDVEWLASTSASSGASVLLKWTLSIASEFGQCHASRSRGVRRDLL